MSRIVGQEGGAGGTDLERVGDMNRVAGPLDPGLTQLESRNVGEAELIEPLGLGPADVARGRAARRIGILVVSDQRLPVLVPGALDRLADLLAGERHGRYSARRGPESLNERDGTGSRRPE